MENPLFRFQVGRFDCLAIRDGRDWDRNVLLVDTGQQRVLIDPGVGQNMYQPPGSLLEGLRTAGQPPDSIDVVVLSHADFDHIGGAVDEKGNLAFPNARYTLTREEWDFWSSNSVRLPPHDAVDEGFRRFINEIPPKLLPHLHDSVDLVASDEQIVPGIRLIAAPGHTPGYVVIALSSDDDHLFFVGDLIRDPKDIEDPNWYSVFDYDPAQAVVTREQILSQASRDRALLMAFHSPFPGLGYASRLGAGWRWTPYEPVDRED